MKSVLAVIDVPRGNSLETRSGIQANHPKIYGRFEDAGTSKEIAYLVAHPTNNFMGHYLLNPLRERGRAMLALNTRYAGNDSMLLMERAIQDVGAGVRFLKREGFRKVVLIGNSGGASLLTFYQEQAENLTIKTTPDGRPIDLSASDLPPGDALVLLAAHCGRALALTDGLDPSVGDETDPAKTESALDMFNRENGPPYATDWLHRYRAAQRERNQRLTQQALSNIQRIDAGELDVDDIPFIVHRTKADPRALDLSIDPSDRAGGSFWGESRQVNLSANGLARFCTSRSFLSQWSYTLSRADGPKNLANTRVPVLNIAYTADEVVFPSNITAWSKAAAGRCLTHEIRGAVHYPQKDPRIVSEVTDLIVDWGTG